MATISVIRFWTVGSSLGIPERGNLCVNVANCVSWFSRSLKSSSAVSESHGTVTQVGPDKN